MYEFYFDKLLFPVTPGSLDVSISNKNKTMSLMNEGEINIPKKAGLTEVKFDLLLPNVEYPFAVYKDGYKPAGYYLEKLEKFKKDEEPFQFIVTRLMPNGKALFDTNLTVILEKYTIKESADEGFDVIVSIELKQYREFGTKKYKINKKPEKPKKPVKRPVKNSPEPKKKAKKYTVKRGDCLWNISKYFYGNGSKWRTIYNANKSKIKNPNLIYPGQVFTIPVL